MELTRRFVFKGYASALSGLIYVPRTAVVDVNCGSSALGIAGGRARSAVGPQSFADGVRIESATTFVEGVFDDERHARAVVSHKARQEELTSTTTVAAEVAGMTVGNNQGPFFTARRLSASLVSRSPDGSGEPRIAPEKPTAITGVAIDGHGLAVTLNLRLFQLSDTFSKLLVAADHPKLVKSAQRNFVMDMPLEGQPRPGRPRLVSSGGIVYTTIVREIRWTGKPFPGARIDGHSVVVPDFGRIFFGELLVSAMERRLTMVRFELGSPFRGFIGGGDVGSNGSWYP